MGLSSSGGQVEDAGNTLLCCSAPPGLLFRPVPACPVAPCTGNLEEIEGPCADGSTRLCPSHYPEVNHPPTDRRAVQGRRMTGLVLPMGTRGQSDASRAP